jgi:hypothetical protein
MICFGLLGFAWWANVPTVDRPIWVYWPAIGSGVLMWCYTGWLFFTDKYSPSEMWIQLKDYLQNGILIDCCVFQLNQDS